EFLAISRRAPVAKYVALREFASNVSVLRSEDGGSTWAPASLGLSHAQFISSLVIDPADPSTIYVAVQNGIFKGTRGGRSWAPVPPPAGLNQWEDVRALTAGGAPPPTPHAPAGARAVHSPDRGPGTDSAPPRGAAGAPTPSPPSRWRPNPPAPPWAAAPPPEPPAPGGVLGAGAGARTGQGAASGLSLGKLDEVVPSAVHPSHPPRFYAGPS